MASLIKSVVGAFTGDEEGDNILPTSQWHGYATDGVLASDMLNETYEGDNVEYTYYDEIGDPVEMVDLQQEQLDEIESEKELVNMAYLCASNGNFRASKKVYVSDFYKDLNPRIPHNAESPDDIVWRVDVDHPVVEILAVKIMAQPVHRIYDQFGDLLFYQNDDLQAAVGTLIELCTKYDLEVLPDPTIEEKEEKERSAEEKKNE